MLERARLLVLVAAVGAVVGTYYYKRISEGKKNYRAINKRKKRSLWVRDIYQKRKELGFYSNVVEEMRLNDVELFFNFTRMNVESFEYLLSLVGPSITKKSPREPIQPASRLMVTLRFLATGDSYPSLGYAFRIAPSTICNIIREVCNALWDCLSPLYLKALTEEHWVKISQDYYNLWQLPNCLGAIDGKHVVVRAPANSGSLYYNYKKDYSIVLFAVCDAKYFFTVVDVGAYGAQSDGGILKNSVFGRKLKDGTLGIPRGKNLPFTDENVPMFFVGDEAFPLQINLLRPYSRRRNGRTPENELIFNYR